MPWSKQPSWTDDQSWLEVAPGTVASYTDILPQPYWATHALYELLVRGTTAATTADLLLAWGASAGALDTTTTNYHNQRIGGSNGANSVPEQTLLNCAIVAAAQAVANYYSPVFVLFPFYKNTKNKQAMIMFSAERAALDQIIGLVNHKRQGGSIVGAQTDAVVATRWTPSAGNLDIASFRRRLI